MVEEKPKASFITFYSFKGGVGRSMALINTAGILAGRGFKVLVIDLDLEAPGLSYLNPDAPDVSPSEQKPRKRPLQLGFVDLLSDAKARGQESDLFALSAGEIAKRYTQVYYLPEELREFKDGSLHIMPAGKFDGGYAQHFDALNLHELYQAGLGEPLIRAFKKKFAEADLYDYVLVDSRTGFSDEAGICTRDLADHLMILSGLNRQNVEGTCEFLKALRVATNGEKRFQIILSPVPNGEDALLDQREKMAKSSFKEAWGDEVDLSLQIPYHPQLALTEEPHIFRRRRGYLFEAYRDIERSMLRSLGHDARTLMRKIQGSLQQKDYPTALQELRHMVRLDSGRFVLSQLASSLSEVIQRPRADKPEGELSQPKTTLNMILNDEGGQRVVEFVVDHLSLDEGWGSKEFLRRLELLNLKFADRLHKRFVEAMPNNANAVSNYGVFLQNRCGDMTGAEICYKRAIEIDPNSANHLGNYANILVHREDMDGAETYYRRAIETDPKNINNLINYALFLQIRRDDADGAEIYHKRAVEAEPNSAHSLGSYAIFLDRCRGNHDDAAAYFNRAIEVDPQNAGLLGGYALFLARRGQQENAETYFQAAMATDPKNIATLVNYAIFLDTYRGNTESAEIYYKRALEIDPKDADSLGNYGQILVGLERIEEGEKMLLSAFEHVGPKLANRAEVCFSLWLVKRLQGQNAGRWERGFKYLIQHGFKRYSWNFDRMFQQAEKKLVSEELKYAKALALAFVDESKVSDLDQFERWRTLKPENPKEAVQSAPSNA